VFAKLSFEDEIVSSFGWSTMVSFEPDSSDDFEEVLKGLDVLSGFDRLGSEGNLGGRVE
jgi:hypothetical protein